MDVLKYRLVCDGSTDANLIPILNWVLRQCSPRVVPHGELAQLWRLPAKPRSLAERIERSCQYSQCSILFVHRDAEREDPDRRRDEILSAVEELGRKKIAMPTVAVVPVRMLEAWLLFDEQAIRRAAGNPNGKEPLQLPSLTRLEERPDPKADLRDALYRASGLQGRRRKKFDHRQAFWRITDYIIDFSPLRVLPAFKKLEAAVQRLQGCDWQPGFYG